MAATAPGGRCDADEPNERTVGISPTDVVDTADLDEAELELEVETLVLEVARDKQVSLEPGPLVTLKTGLSVRAPPLSKSVKKTGVPRGASASHWNEVLGMPANSSTWSLTTTRL